MIAGRWKRWYEIEYASRCSFYWVFLTFLTGCIRMVRKKLCSHCPDACQPAIRLLELAHIVCIMDGLFVMTITRRGQTIDGTPKSLSAGFFFSGSVGPVVQVSKICLLAYIDRFVRTDPFRHFLQPEWPNVPTNHIWRSFVGLWWFSAFCVTLCWLQRRLPRRRLPSLTLDGNG